MARYTSANYSKRLMTDIKVFRENILRSLNIAHDDYMLYYLYALSGIASKECRFLSFQKDFGRYIDILNKTCFSAYYVCVGMGDRLDDFVRNKNFDLYLFSSSAVQRSIDNPRGFDEDVAEYLQIAASAVFMCCYEKYDKERVRSSIRFGSKELCELSGIFDWAKKRGITATNIRKEYDSSERDAIRESIEIIGEVLLDHYLHAEKRFIHYDRELLKRLYSEHKDDAKRTFALLTLSLGEPSDFDPHQSLYRYRIYEELADVAVEVIGDYFQSLSNEECAPLLTFVCKVSTMFNYVIKPRGWINAVVEHRSGLVNMVFEEFKQIKIVE